MRKDINYTEQIITYLEKNLKKGYTKESLRWALINQGHSRIEIEKALKKVEITLASKAPVLRTRPKITYKVEEIPLEDELKNHPNYKSRINQESQTQASESKPLTEEQKIIQQVQSSIKEKKKPFWKGWFD